MIGAWFAPYVPQAQKLFWMHRMVLLGDEAQIEAHFGLFGYNVSFSANRCTVCAKNTIALENNFGHSGWYS
jgi:hypothetical protein